MTNRKIVCNGSHVRGYGRWWSLDATSGKAFTDTVQWLRLGQPLDDSTGTG